MSKIALIVMAVCSLCIATPAFATKGIEAARLCETTPGCKVNYEEGGGILIQPPNDGPWVHCPGPQDECRIMRFNDSDRQNRIPQNNSGTTVLSR